MLSNLLWRHHHHQYHGKRLDPCGSCYRVSRDRSCKFTYGYLTQYITYLTILPSATYLNTIYFSDSSYQLPDVTDRIQVTAQVTIQRPITTIKVRMVLYSKTNLIIVPELIPVLGSQPAGDWSHKPGGRLPLLSSTPRLAVEKFTDWNYCSELSTRWSNNSLNAPPPYGGGIKRWCASDVCLLRTSGLSREQRDLYRRPKVAQR